MFTLWKLIEALNPLHSLIPAWCRFDNTHQELSKATAHNKELQREMERLQSEVTRLKTQQLKAAKDSEKYKEERDSVISEYRLIMSERDQVIKEVDRLQTGLEMAEAKLKSTSSERRVASEELEALRQVKAKMRDHQWELKTVNHFTDGIRKHWRNNYCDKRHLELYMHYKEINFFRFTGLLLI